MKCALYSTRVHLLAMCTNRCIRQPSHDFTFGQPGKDADARRYFLLTDLDTSDIHCRMVERTRSMVEHEIDDTLREHLVSGAGDGPAGRAWMA